MRQNAYQKSMHGRCLKYKHKFGSASLSQRFCVAGNRSHHVGMHSIAEAASTKKKTEVQGI